MAPSRKAWNEAMRTAGQSASRPGALRVGPKASNTVVGDGGMRSSGRQRMQSRAQRAKKTLDRSESTKEQQAYRDALHIDALEEAVVDDEFYNAAGSGLGESGGGDEEYVDDETFDSDSEDGSSSMGRRRGAKRAKGASSSTNRRRGATSSSGRGRSASSRKPTSAAAVAAEKERKRRPRSLASILIEEASRPNGNSYKYLAAEARLSSRDKNIPYPTRKFCPVTGLFGAYTDPKTQISFATVDALEQLRERSPPWMTLGGTAAYYEACKSLRNED